MSDLFEEPEVEANKRGQIVVLPESTQLFIDIDDKESRQVMDEMLEVLRNNGFEIGIQKELPSRSGGSHVYLEVLQELDEMERVALQACLGSDRKRELLSYLRIYFDVDRTKRPPTTFFEDPPKGQTKPHKKKQSTRIVDDVFNNVPPIDIDDDIPY